ncbi:MAG: hypothetical protein EPO21_20170 [Chloroflexota bacterium]|nr:MAG: hypothetical protein EPO21_20170 [Chloroflexota bacterium]
MNNGYWMKRGILLIICLGVIVSWVGMTLSPLVIHWEPPDLLYAGAVLVLLAAICLIAIIVADVAGEVTKSDH